MQSERLIRCLTWLTSALLAASCAAQVVQQPGPLPGRSLARNPIHQAAPTPPQPAAAPGKAAALAKPAATAPGQTPESRPALPPSLLDKPAEPAKITLKSGLLTIQADNSSLSAILHYLATSGGMAVDGLEHDQRVFGTYGPGSPRDVLSGLLQDAGYNFLMAGITEQGTPKEILLTARVGGAAPTGAAASGPAQPASDDQPDEDENSGNNNYPQEPPMPERTVPPIPNDRVKSPAEIIQELQRLRQQQQNPQ